MPLVELVRTETPDGLFLDGALHPPAEATPEVPIDAVLLLHGSGSHFYAAGVLEEFANRAATNGVTALRVNTRGHDGMTRVAGRNGASRGGAAYENVADCRLDVRGWLSFLESRGLGRVLLAGHSMGGVKSVFAAAHERFDSVVAVATISSPRFHHARLATRPAFVEEFRRAVGLVEEGHGDTLLQVREPLPLVMTAAAVVAKYGPDDEYDLVRHLPNVPVPVLYVVGTESVRTSVAFETMIDDVGRLAEEHLHVSLEVVEGANTVYSGRTGEPFERVWTWLRRIGG